MNKFIKIALAVGAAVAAGSANAATASTTLGVSATVQASCTAAAASLAFGIYVPGALLNATTTIDVRCTGGTSYNIGFDGGGAGAAAVTARRMASGANLLEYALYRDPARTLNWGNTVGTDTLAGSGTGLALANPVTIYGQIPNSTGNQNAAAATFNDVVNVTVTY